MEIKVTVNGDRTLLEIIKNGQPVSPQNPVTPQELSDLKSSVSFQVSGGSLAIISGMPGWATAAVAIQVKNLFQAVAMYDPRIADGKAGAVIVHSVSPGYQVSQIIPL